MPEAKDKRLVPREPVHLVTEIELDGRQIGCGVSRDASGAGLLLLTHLNLPQGSELALRLYVPPEVDARLLSASVVRCERIPPHRRGRLGLPSRRRLPQSARRSSAARAQFDQGRVHRTACHLARNAR